MQFKTSYNDLKWVHQREKAVQAAKARISQIRNSFTYFDCDLVRLLHVSLIRPHLEYAVPVWTLKMCKIINKIDHVNLRNELLEKDRGLKADRRVI